MLETRFVITADGRRLAYCIGGDADGFPVFALHGTPGGRLLRRDDIYAPDGVLGISYDRPGYGQSTRHRGRTVADGAGDIAAIADDLGLTTFAGVGGVGWWTARARGGGASAGPGDPVRHNGRHPALWCGESRLFGPHERHGRPAVGGRGRDRKVNARFLGRSRRL